MQISPFMKFELLNNIPEADIVNNRYLIYGHYCKDGIYIGMSEDPVKRWQEHYFDAFNSCSKNYFDRFRVAIRENRNNFRHLILQTAKSKELAKNKEAEAIEYYDANLNMKLEFNMENDGFGYEPLDGQVPKVIVLRKKGRPGAWVPRNDDDRVAVIAEVYIYRGRKRLRSIEHQYFPAGLNIECSRAEREKFSSGDLVMVDVALSIRNGRQYLVAAKTAPLMPV